MSDTKACPKCGGKMPVGSLRDVGQYGGPSPFVWSPADDAPFPVKGAPAKRRQLVLYRCEGCGYVEVYAP
jgi:uncharacterized Zn finger protein